MGSNLIKITETLQCLETLSESAQNEIKDKLMVVSENEWHDVKQLYRRFEADEIVDFNETPYTWYREDDLEEYGYIHESYIMERAVDDIEGLCKQLAKEKQPQTIIGIETLHCLYTGQPLEQVETDLVKAILDEAGYDV